MGNVHRSYIIDLNKWGDFLEATTDRKHGKFCSGLQVRDEGPCSKTKKWNLSLAICVEDLVGGFDAHRWADITMIHKMTEFIQSILDDISPATAENFYMFTMDNLNSHKTPSVIALIHLYVDGVVYRNK